MKTAYFTIANADGAPCVAASANGRCNIIAVMTNTEQGHELADAVCADLNTKTISTNRRLNNANH